MEQSFENEIQSVKHHKTPAGTNDRVVRPQDVEALLEKVQQTKYRHGVGMLLYLVKISRPDLANVTRELSKVMDGSTNLHLKWLYRALKYVCDTSHFGLKIDPIMTK